MKRYLLLFLSAVILAACGNEASEQLTAQQIEAEKAKVLDVIKEYNDAYQNESFTKIIETLDEKVMFFGTDSAEVIKSLNEFKTMIQDQWKHYEIKYGNIVDPLVIMDDKATVASVIFGIPGSVALDNGPAEHVFFRIARTLVKKDKKWMIASGVIGITQKMPDKNPQTDAEEGKTAEKADSTTPTLK